MRIGFDAKRAFHNSSGLGNYSRDLIRILSNKWVDDEFVLFNPKEKNKDFGQNSVNSIQVTPSAAWTKLHAAWRTFRLSEIISRQNIDVYHGLSNELPVRLKTPSIVTIHDLIFERFPEWYKPIDRRIYRSKFKRAAEQADTVVAISEQTKQDLIDIYGIAQSKIKVVYQGCHNAFKEKGGLNDDLIVSKYKLPEKYILSVGTIEPRKNLMTVVKAIADLPEVHIAIVGRETSYANQIRSFITQNNLSNRVHFIKGVNMPELASLYRKARAFVYASQFEGFGIPIIEALFSYTPVITSTGSCFSEAGGPHSIYLPFDDVSAWRKQIKELWGNDELLESMAFKGHEYAQKFTDEQLILKWENIYAPFR
jgi:glycosyltransferase involved in cell wall biosynthesis